MVVCPVRRDAVRAADEHALLGRSMVAIACCVEQKPGYAVVMGVSTVLQALAGAGVLLAAVIVGVCMFLCARGHFPSVWSRLQQSLREQRKDGGS
jgi:hypothetical protein